MQCLNVYERVRGNLATNVLTVALLLSIAQVGICQTPANQEPGPDEEDTPEEITVYGQQSIVALRYEIYRAEDNFFALFNSLNENDEFDVTCGRNFQIREHRRVRQCQPEFLMDYLEDFARGFNPNLATLRRKEKLLVEEMTKQISEHPELLEVFNEMAKLKRTYKARREDR